MKIYNRPVAIIGKFFQPKKSGTSAAGAITINETAASLTTETLTTAQNATYTLTITNSQVKATDLVFASVFNGTNSAGLPVLVSVEPKDGSIVIKITNKIDTATALNGTLRINFFVVGQI